MYKFSLIDIDSNFKILDHVPDLVKITCRSGMIMYANKAMTDEVGKKIYGKTNDFLRQKYNSEIFDQDFIKSLNPGEVKKKKIEHNGKIYDLSLSSILDPTGEISAYIEIFRDITKQAKQEREYMIQTESLNRDINTTKKIQQSILPSQKSIGKIHFSFFYTPCQNLSGDIFDVVSINENLVSAYICDVAGHGIPAAMITIFVRETMRNIENASYANENLKTLHERFLNLGLDKEQYLTIENIIIDTKRNKVSYSNAGHNCPIFHVRGNDVNTIFKKGKPITSLFEEIIYTQEEFDFLPGDQLLLITDGIIETKNQDGETYGINRVISEIKKSPDDILTALNRSMNLFSEELHNDDKCALLIRYGELNEIG